MADGLRGCVLNLRNFDFRNHDVGKASVKPLVGRLQRPGAEKLEPSLMLQKGARRVPRRARDFLACLSGAGMLRDSSLRLALISSEQKGEV